MKKVTKKPKRVSIILHETVSTYSEYYCPSCKTRFVGAGISSKIMRFKCDCGQELIVDKFLRAAERN